MAITVTAAQVMEEFGGVASPELIARSPKDPHQLCNALCKELGTTELGKASSVPTR